MTISAFSVTLMCSYATWMSLGPAGDPRRLRPGRPVRSVRRALWRRLRRRLAAGERLALAPGRCATRCCSRSCGRRCRSSLAIGLPARHRRCLDGARRASRAGSSWSPGRRRWPATSRPRRSRASAPTTGWDRSRCCRSASSLSGPLASVFGARTVLGVGGAIGVVATLRHAGPEVHARADRRAPGRCRGPPVADGTGEPAPAELAQPSSSRARSA